MPAGAAAKPPKNPDVKKYAACLQNTSPLAPVSCDGSGAPSVLAGGSTATMHLTVTNDLSSSQSLGSVNLDAPSGLSIVLGSWTFLSGGGDFGSGTSASQIQLRNLSLSPGSSTVVQFDVKAPCSGTGYAWAISAKQSNTFLGTGNDFQPPKATGLTSDVTGTCRLEWVTQPASALVDTLVTGSAFDPSGPKVAVKAVDGSGAPLTSVSGETVTLARTAGPSATFSGLSAAFDASGVATFGGLQSSTTGTGFKLQASSTGFQPTPQSGPFDIMLTATTCTTSGCQTDPLNVNGVFVQAQTSSSNFLLIGIGTLRIGVPEGCANFRPLGDAPIVVTDLRTSLSGDIFVTYGLRKNVIQKRFGSNSGEQFIPICAGAKRLALSGGTTVAVDCDDDSVYGHQDGWLGKTLDAEGRFDLTAPLTEAVCDPVTGYFFGILGSFQDYTNSDPAKRIDGSTNPTVVGWNSDNTYRYFTTKFPSASGTGTLAGVPWDGWKFG